MTAVATDPTCLNLAVLAELHPTTCRPNRVVGVMAWTDDGQRHYAPLLATRTIPDDLGPQLATAPEAAGGRADQLQFDFGAIRPATSSGLTWRTWSLPTIPIALRHLAPHNITRELAAWLGG